MARASRRAVGRMEKLQTQGLEVVPAGSQVINTFQFDGGEVEAQVKRIMLSFGAPEAKLLTWQLGLFQKTPSAPGDFDDETVVISGAFAVDFQHNETITMRVPKDWTLGLLIANLGSANADITYNLQCNYKVLN